MAADAPSSPESLETLFLSEESRLLHYATGLTGNFATAQDLVQEAFLRLHRVRETVVQPRAWLFVTIRRLASNYRRKHQRLSALEEAHENTGEPDAVLPVEEMERSEAVLLLRLCLEELPERDRELVQLKFENELSYEEIARRTGLSSGNVGYRLHHALKAVTRLFHAAQKETPAQPATQKK